MYVRLYRLSAPLWAKEGYEAVLKALDIRDVAADLSEGIIDSDI